MSGDLEWGPWQPTRYMHDGDPAETDPYVHWWRDAEGSSPHARAHFPVERFDFLQFLYSRNKGADASVEDMPFDGRFIPVPTDSRNPDWKAPDRGAVNWVDDSVVDALTSGCEQLDKDTIIVGVIDSGIGLSHRRFRLTDGTTRFLASWQQTATWDISKQSYLPFGRELYGQDINALLRNHSDGGDLKKSLDEDAFNRAATLVEPHRVTGAGQRDLDYRGAHGTNVLDLLSGYDTELAEQAALAEKTRIIAVNLPTPFVHGPAVNFLQYFSILAIERIYALADALWERWYPNEPGRFPVVLNMSYGMQAGPKDGSLPFEKTVKTMVRSYSGKGGLLRVVMPSGNKNLYRGTARFTPSRDTLCELPWRIPPSDHTSNIVEIWAPEMKKGELKPGDFRVWLTPPGCPPLSVPVLKEMGTDALPNAHTDLKDANGNVIARVYCRLHEDTDFAPGERQRLQTVLCVCPTATVEPSLDVGLAPAGVWTIGVKHFIAGRPEIDIHVQADHAGELSSMKAQTSYFDDPNHERRHPNGRHLDTAPYGPDQPGEHRGRSAVTRFGSHNPLATTEYILMIGGYDCWDGRPALYSGSGRNADRRMTYLDVDAALPSEDCPATYGILAAGSRDGARVSFRGTSMSSALAARHVIEAIANHGVSDLFDYGPLWLRCQVQRFECNKPNHYHDAAPAKVGYGRLGYPETYKDARRNLMTR